MVRTEKYNLIPGGEVSGSFSKNCFWGSLEFGVRQQRLQATMRNMFKELRETIFKVKYEANDSSNRKYQ